MQKTLNGRAGSKVYLTLQSNPKEKGRDSRTIAVQQCGGKPNELCLRFGGCCLKCGPCFASGYSWIDLFDHNVRVNSMKTLEDILQDYEIARALLPPEYESYNWLRILGGEPLLNDDYVQFVFDIILKISKIDSKMFNNGVVIQTNGIFIGQGNTRLLRAKLEELFHSNPKVKVCIEVSIKGTNVEEFKLITQAPNRSASELSKFEKAFGWSLGAYSPAQLFNFNIQAYYKLKELASDLPNFCPTVIAGFGVNESFLLKEGNSPRRITIIFRDNRPIYHPDFWSQDFKKLYEDFTKEAPKKFGSQFSKMPMYGIKDQFGYIWVYRSIRQAERIYGNRWYDFELADGEVGRNISLEEAFPDILDKFFLVDNKTYYSTLINWKT